MPSPRDEEPAPVVGAEVATSTVSVVGHRVIDRKEVQETARRLSIEPKDALRFLQDQALLASEATRAGYASHPEVRWRQRQAAVQVLLAAYVERGGAAESDDVRRERLRQWLGELAQHTPVWRRPSPIE